MRKVLYICVGDGPVRCGRVIFLEESAGRPGACSEVIDDRSAGHSF